MTESSIIGSWKKKQFKPVYWLEGEEDYFIDRVMHFAEHELLSEAEVGFNLTVFYGRDADWTAVVNACMRYPMFAERQVVLLKEAQHMKEIDKLEHYITHPLTTTVFVIAFKEKKLDGRTSLSKVLKKAAEVMTTKKMPDGQLASWSEELVVSKGFSIAPKALNLLVDHIGNELSRINSEIDKLTLNLNGRKTITEDDIETYVGISKEYNAFELQAAVSRRDLSKAIRIVQYFESNPKAAPIQLILPTLYNMFSRAYAICGLPSQDERTVSNAMGLAPYLLKDAIVTARNYGFEGVKNAILLLYQFNLRNVGINEAGASSGELLKEMLFKMMTGN
jgi:DNA polymerase-3 subunit delta